MYSKLSIVIEKLTYSHYQVKTDSRFSSSVGVFLGDIAYWRVKDFGYIQEVDKIMETLRNWGIEFVLTTWKNFSWQHWMFFFHSLHSVMLVSVNYCVAWPSVWLSLMLTASLSWSKAPIWGLRPDLYYLCGSYGLLLVGRPLWREVGSLFCMCCWTLPAQSFSGPLGLETIFYCLRFETSLFVASNDSQGHGGGIRPHLHTGNSVGVGFCD
jgi:hypothetical protein